MRRLTAILVAGLLAACGSDPTTPPDSPGPNQLRVLNGPAKCVNCNVITLSVSGPGLDRVIDVAIRHHVTKASVATSTEIRHFVGDSGLILDLRMVLGEATPEGDYDLILERFSTDGEAAPLTIPRAIKVTGTAGGGNPPPPPPPTGPTGEVRVYVPTSGQLPSVQYLVTVAPCNPAFDCPVPYVLPGQAVTLTLSPGTYTLGLSGVPSACTILEPRTVSVTIVAGQRKDAVFTITCPPAPPPTRATVAVTTTGVDLDSGFRLVIGNCDDYYYNYCNIQEIPANRPVTFEVAPGVHNVQLTGVAGNCTVAAPNLREVTFEIGTTTELAYAVWCVAAARIHVTAPTSGVDQDQGYLVRFGNCESGSCSETWLPTTASLDTTVLPGTYDIELRDIASNCAVSGANPVTVNAMVGATSNVSFPVTCAALPPPPPPGIIRISAPTSGTNLDLGYEVINETNCDYYYGCTSVPLGATGYVEFTLAPGTYSFRLQGIANNCQVMVSNPSAIQVASGFVTEFTFPVLCR